VNDPNEFFASYERYRAALNKASESNKTAVFALLAAANITLVVAEFDGEGDSGAITEVTAYRGEKPVQLPTDTVTLQQASFRSAELTTTEQELPQAIETLCYDCLEERYGGWENDDGGYGKFRFDVAERVVTLEFNGRYSDVFTETRTV
jgi:hypothetical protein